MFRVWPDTEVTQITWDREYLGFGRILFGVIISRQGSYNAPGEVFYSLLPYLIFRFLTTSVLQRSVEKRRTLESLYIHTYIHMDM